MNSADAVAAVGYGLRVLPCVTQLGCELVTAYRGQLRVLLRVGSEEDCGKSAVAERKDALEAMDEDLRHGPERDDQLGREGFNLEAEHLDAEQGELRILDSGVDAECSVFDAKAGVDV